MSLRIQTILLAFGALLAGFLFTALVLRLSPASSAASYAVLSLDEGVSDAGTARALAPLAEKYGRASLLAESSQQVLLNTFDGLETISLEAFSLRVEPFDPRNDGFAGLLHSFFVRDGKRLFFIPLKKSLSAWGVRAFEKDAAACLPGTPFGSSYTGYGRPVIFYMALFILAAVSSAVLSASPLSQLCLIPLLAAPALSGPAGFALAAILSILAALSLEPCRQIFAAYRYKRDGNHVLNTLMRSSPSLVVSAGLCFAAFFVVLLVYLPAALALLFPCFAGVWLFALRLESCRGSAVDHVRFMPVPILPFPSAPLRFPKTGLPFALAALLALFTPLLVPVLNGKSGGVLPGSSPLTMEDYRSHVRFQTSFSFIPLGDEEAVPSFYTLGEDGLIAAGGQADPAFTIPEDAPPPFPLAELLGFLEGGGVPVSPFVLADLFPPLLALIFSVPAFIQEGRGGGKKKKVLLLIEKWVAA